MSRTGLKMGGATGTKDVLAQRLAHWLNEIVEAGQYLTASEASEDEGAHRKPRIQVVLQPYSGGAVGVPDHANVTAEQAESALGHVQATDIDNIFFEELDLDQKEEEMALIGRTVNPPGVSYDCLAWSPVLDSDLAASVGWHPPLPQRAIDPAEFRAI